MTGLICLQGGAEFQRGCEEMDAAVVRAALRARRDDDRPLPAAHGTDPSDLSGASVVVLPFAGRPGRERQVAGGNAQRWYEGLGAGRTATVLDEDDPALADAVRSADVVVLPGGSPSRLLEALRPHVDVLRAALAGGHAVSGASAGAMVLCRWTVLPEGRRRIAPGLGLADVDLVLPHYRGSTSWLDGDRSGSSARDLLPRGAVVLGLPERSGVLLGPDGSREAAGVERYTEISLD